jgi:hypothetical protein
MVPADPKPARRPRQACASMGRRFASGQANPSPAKQIQIKLLGFAWLYLSESGFINGLQRFQTRILLLASPHRDARLVSDGRDDIGRLPIFRKIGVE